MMKKFSSAWKKSKNPGKQRKYRAQAPNHIKRKMMSALLSKELRKQYDKRSLSLRKGDSVLVMRGNSKGSKGKITDVDMKEMKIKVDGVTIKKANGEKVQVFIEPSNVMITLLNMDDVKRKKFMKRKNPVKKVEEKVEEKK